jgi:glycerol kinase
VGLPFSSYFSGPKVRWILENVEGVKEAAGAGDALFGTMDSWVIWWLTGGPQGGVHVTDVTNASRTMLMDLATLEWDGEMLEIMGIPRQMLPEIRPSSDPCVYGYTVADGPLGGSVPVCGDVGDQQAALVGHACFGRGEVKNTYGTGCFMLLNTGERVVSSRSGLLTTVGFKVGDGPAVYCLEGSVAIAGALVQWLRDNMGFFESLGEVEKYARDVDDSGGVYFVPAFSGLYAPYWDGSARGLVIGLTHHTRKEHVCRAALEATAYQVRDVLEAMEEDTGYGVSELRVDGGMVENELLMQFQADILGVPLASPGHKEMTSLGAAHLAGLAVGCWDDFEELCGMRSEGFGWWPEMDGGTREALYRDWQRAVERARGWVE